MTCNKSVRTFIARAGAVRKSPVVVAWLGALLGGAAQADLPIYQGDNGTVNIYGQINLALEQATDNGKDKNGKKSSYSYTQINSSSLDSSTRLGFSGSLFSGVIDKTSFEWKLESGYRPNDGQNAGSSLGGLGDRESWAGIKNKDFGMLYFGRGYGAFDGVDLTHGPYGRWWGGGIANHKLMNMTAGGVTTRIDSMLRYDSPVWSGFSFQAHYTAEGNDIPGQPGTNGFGLRVNLVDSLSDDEKKAGKQPLFDIRAGIQNQANLPLANCGTYAPTTASKVALTEACFLDNKSIRARSSQTPVGDAKLAFQDVSALVRPLDGLEIAATVVQLQTDSTTSTGAYTFKATNYGLTAAYAFDQYEVRAGYLQFGQINASIPAASGNVDGTGTGYTQPFLTLAYKLVDKKPVVARAYLSYSYTSLDTSAFPDPQTNKPTYIDLGIIGRF